MPRDKTKFKKWVESLTPEQRAERKEKSVEYLRNWRARKKGYKDHADFLANAPEWELIRWERLSNRETQRKQKTEPMDSVAFFKSKNQRPPWEIVGWTQKQYRRWLKRLEATL